MFCVHTWEVFMFMQHSSCNYFTMIQQPVACTNSSAAKKCGCVTCYKSRENQRKKTQHTWFICPWFFFLSFFFIHLFCPRASLVVAQKPSCMETAALSPLILWQCSVTAERMQKDPEYAGAPYPNSEMLQMRWMFSSLSSTWRGFATTRRFCFIAARGGSWARACLAPSTSL